MTAQFLGQTKEPPLSGFDAMGSPVPSDRKQRAYDTCKSIGLNSAEAFECTNCVAEQLERDKPYEAMEAGMRYLDLTGTYRLMAVLLTSES